jgi:hypothetical protein
LGPGRSLVAQGQGASGRSSCAHKFGTVRVTDLNPTNPLFAIDEAQNRAFRRAAFYNEAKRQAFRNMKRELNSGRCQAQAACRAASQAQAR